MYSIGSLDYHGSSSSCNTSISRNSSRHCFSFSLVTSIERLIIPRFTQQRNTPRGRTWFRFEKRRAIRNVPRYNYIEEYFYTVSIGVRYERDGEISFCFSFFFFFRFRRTFPTFYKRESERSYIYVKTRRTMQSYSKCNISNAQCQALIIIYNILLKEAMPLPAFYFIGWNPYEYP